MAALITLNEYKVATGVPLTDVSNDTQLTWLVTVASSMVSNYAQRDFGSPSTTEARTFEYDGSGFLDIDDATSITSVSLLVPGGSPLVLDPTYQWFPRPPRRDDSPVYYYLSLPGFIGSSGFSPEMGFTRNLDRWAADYGIPEVPTTLSVTGTWGWAVVPDDVKQATIWTIDEWMDRQDGESLTAEAISGYSRSWGQKGGMSSPALAVPDRARDVLSNYEKHYA